MVECARFVRAIRAPRLSNKTGIRHDHRPRGAHRILGQPPFPNIYFCSAFMRDLTASKNWPVTHAGVIHCGIETAAFPVKGSLAV
jgi:hypothetical protein